MEERIRFIIGDKLPTYHEVGISIFNECQKMNSDKMSGTINAYSDALIKLWIKAFGDNHVLSRKVVKKKVESLVEHYNNHVYLEAHRTKPKKKGMPFEKKSMRHLNKLWRGMTIKKTGVKVDSLFDICKDSQLLTGVEKDFYEDQKFLRIGRLSEEVDEEYVIERQEKIEEERRRIEREASEYVMDLDDDGNNEQNHTYESKLDTSLNRSGLSRKTSSVNDVGIQCVVENPRPKIRTGSRNCSLPIKSTCAEVSVKCNISTECSRIAVQTVCQTLYGHQYYLDRDEAIEKDPNLAEFREFVPKIKKCKTDDKWKTPSTKEDYKIYENVLPTAKTINDHKQILALYHEKEAASALRDLPSGVKVTLHYDTTSRSKIDGDWPSLILIFSDNRRFSLRPIFFAYEDRDQIIRLITETYNRLSLTLSMDDVPATAKELWEKTTAIMTDSVSKNLKVEDGVAECLGSDHKPYHLLCKSHAVEAFDRSNIDVLSSIEKQLQFRDKLIAINPAIRSFLRSGPSVVQAGIKSILNFISHDKSASSTNQADLFDFILQRENQVKHIALYHERRFTKLGYSAASILDSFKYLRMVVDESHLNNQHIEMVRMFLDSEFFSTELSVLAYFTYRVTLPFLYCVEISSQDDLLEIFPKLYDDLKNKKMNTLDKYVINYSHVTVQNPVTETEKNLLELMCVEAAKVLYRQCAREYGFSKDSDVDNRATKLDLLTTEELAHLPTNNIPAERHLAAFGRRAPVANFRNKKFKAKAIRNDMTLYQTTTFASSNVKESKFVEIIKVLNNMEVTWTDQQMELKKKQIMEKLVKAKNVAKYTQKLLETCKTWGGPVTSVAELQQILQENPDLQEKIVRTELSYYRDTHKSDIANAPELFKLNRIDHEERVINFCALLGGNSFNVNIELPTNHDANQILNVNLPLDGDDDEEIKIGEDYVTLVNEGGVNTWYIAKCTGYDENSSKYQMTHLHRVKKTSNLRWMHPRTPDIEDMFTESIVHCKIDGNWDISNERNMIFILKNHEFINNLVVNM